MTPAALLIDGVQGFQRRRRERQRTEVIVQRLPVVEAQREALDRLRDDLAFLDARQAEVGARQRQPLALLAQLSPEGEIVELFETKDLITEEA